MTAVSRLTREISRWTRDSDRKLVRLMSYVKGASDVFLKGRLNYQDADSLVIHAWPDADLAGDEMTTKSTSGFFLELAGPGGRGIPVSWGSKRQGCTATHTAEAEIVSLASCLKSEVIPTQMLIEHILGRPVPAIIFEDNAAAIVAASKGYSPSMRYLKRTQRT